MSILASALTALAILLTCLGTVALMDQLILLCLRTRYLGWALAALLSYTCIAAFIWTVTNE